MMRFCRENARIGLITVIWGVWQAQEDLDVFCLYFGFLVQLVSCANLVPIYGLFYMPSVIVYGAYESFACGWLTDWATEKKSDRALLIGCMIAQTILLIGYFVPYHAVALWFGHVVGPSDSIFSPSVMWLLLFYIMRSLVTTQSEFSIWKIIKLYVDDASETMTKHGESSEREIARKANEVMLTNRVGNTGDVFSDSIGALVLGLLALLAYTHEDMLAWTLPALIAAQFLLHAITFAMILFLHVPYDHLALEKDEPLIAKPSISFPTKIKRNFTALWQNKIALHTMLQCMLVSIFFSLAEVPMTVEESAGGSNILPPDQQTASNLCGNVVLNFISQGAILNALYFASTLLYAKILVRCPLRKFYLIAYPVRRFALCAQYANALQILGTCILAVTLSMWYNIPYQLVTFFLVALAQILSYYASDYGYYSFTAHSDPLSYGFNLSIYSFLSTVTNIGLGYFLLVPVSNHYWMGLGIILAVLSLAYSVWIAFRVAPHHVEL
jgi:hypothetical protein